MAEPTILQLAQDLEWLGCEEEHYGHKHAMEGFPEAGPSWDTFREKQRGVLITADKIERELKNAVDTLITIPNQRLLSIASRTTSLKDAFQKADDVLLQREDRHRAEGHDADRDHHLDQGEALRGAARPSWVEAHRALALPPIGNTTCLSRPRVTVVAPEFT